jgi:hypothetical protein
MAVQTEHPSTQLRERFLRLSLSSATTLTRDNFPDGRRADDSAAEARKARLIAGVFLARSTEGAEWTHLSEEWAAYARIHEDNALAEQLAGLWTLHRRHLPLIMDTHRNTIFNRLSLSILLRRFYQTYPAAPLPANYMEGTLLFNADPSCIHSPQVKSSGVACSTCPGWFCF